MANNTCICRLFVLDSEGVKVTVDLNNSPLHIHQPSYIMYDLMENVLVQGHVECEKERLESAVGKCPWNLFLSDHCDIAKFPKPKCSTMLI